MQKRIFLLVMLALVFAADVAWAGKISCDGVVKGIKLYGRVKVVEHFPDIKVKIVQHFPDLKVQFVDNFPDKLGKWQIVEHFENFKVQFVNSGEDIKIQVVEHFPGF